MVTLDAGTLTFCYSNGVREIQRAVDGGLALVLFTKPDGHTICYQVYIDSNGVDHYQTTAGQDVAQLASAGGVSTVTCADGTTHVVNDDPSCLTVTSSDCGSGACP
jgi:hypothetical protein